MTISFGAIGAKSAGGTTSVNVDYPTGISAGHALVLADCGWPAAAGVNAITNWTVGQTTGGTGSSADAHDTTLALFYKTTGATGSESGTLAVGRGGTPNGQLGVMARYTSTGGFTFGSFELAGGADNTHGADRSITTSVNLTLAVGDVLVAGVAMDTDAALTITSPTFTASGITFGSVTARTTVGAGGVATGNDGNVEIFDAAVTAGSGTVAVTFAFTCATSQCGGVRIVKLREATTQTLTPAQVTEGEASAGTVSLKRQLNPGQIAEAEASLGAVTAVRVVLTAGAVEAESTGGATVVVKRPAALGQVVEAEAPLAAALVRRVGLPAGVAEAEASAGALALIKRVGLAAAVTESETAQAVTGRRTIVAGEVTEAELAQAVTTAQAGSVQFRQVVELESVAGAVVVKRASLGAGSPAIEDETSVGATRVQRLIGLAAGVVEVEAGLAVGVARLIGLAGSVVEAEAGGGSWALEKLVGVAGPITETELAFLWSIFQGEALDYALKLMLLEDRLRVAVLNERLGLSTSDDRLRMEVTP
jgi:hypothetical protein